jgi:hypothetical protein
MPAAIAAPLPPPWPPWRRWPRQSADAGVAEVITVAPKTSAVIVPVSALRIVIMTFLLDIPGDLVGLPG